jgi:hypothetical protein
MNSLELNAMHTAARIDADRQPNRLERGRQRREALAVTHQRPVLVHQLGMWFSQVGTWLQGPSPDIPPAITADPETFRTG